MDSALFAEEDEEPRIRAVLQSLVDAKELPAFKAFTHESAKKKSNRKRRVHTHTCSHSLCLSFTCKQCAMLYVCEVH